MERSDSIKRHNQSNNIMIAGLALVVIAVVLLILFFINGETSISGKFPDPDDMISTTCRSGTIAYPYFKIDGSDRKELDIKIVSDNEKVDTISLVYRLYYSSEAAIIESRDVNHFAMNKAFEVVDMEADSLGATYSKLTDNFRFNLFAKAIKINDITKKFFLLDDVGREGGLDYEEVRKTYIEQGFECRTDDENNMDEK